MVVEEGDEEVGPERQQLGQGAAAVEEENEEAGPERQQVGWRSSGLTGEQRPWRKRMRK